jgi:hypothetical protein
VVRFQLTLSTIRSALKSVYRTPPTFTLADADRIHDMGKGLHSLCGIAVGQPSYRKSRLSGLGPAASLSSKTSYLETVYFP